MIATTKKKKVFVDPNTKKHFYFLLYLEIINIQEAISAQYKDKKEIKALYDEQFKKLLHNSFLIKGWCFINNKK